MKNFFNYLGNKFKEPIYKDDLKKAFLYGILSAIIFGVLYGLADGLISRIIRIILFIFMICPSISKMIRKNITTGHIWYGILVVILAFVGLFVYNLTDILLSLDFEFKYLKISHILNITFNPYQLLIVPFKYSTSFSDFFWQALKIIFFIMSLVTGYKIAKSN